MNKFNYNNVPLQMLVLLLSLWNTIENRHFFVQNHELVHL